MFAKHVAMLQNKNIYPYSLFNQSIMLAMQHCKAATLNM